MSVPINTQSNLLINECINSGEAHVSSFIQQEDFYNGDFIAKAWVWFMAHNKIFKAIYPSVHVPELNESNFSPEIIDHYTQFWEPIFEILTNFSKHHKLIVLLASSNDPNIQNTIIVYENNTFRILSSTNSNENINRMNALLVSEDKFGKFTHVLITTPK